LIGHAFRFENGELAQLSGAPTGFILTDAFGVSHDGSVIVGVGIPTGGDTEAFRWENGVVTRLGDLQGGLPRSVARAVSADGRVVVGYGYVSGHDEAFRWEDGVMQGLGRLPGSGSSRAYAVSADGRVIVGVSAVVPGGGPAFRWENGRMEPLEGPEGGSPQLACAVSADGAVIGGLAYGPSGYKLIRWVHGDVEVLGSIISLVGDLRCAASGDGSTIVWGQSLDDYDSYPAYIWHTTFGLVRMRDYLSGTLGLNLSSWRLGKPSGVSLDGLTVVGWGFNAYFGIPDYNEGWIAFLGRTGAESDSDGDGVVDSLDLCPRTIVGVNVDPTGCPPLTPGDLDRDGDVDLGDYAAWQRCMSGADEPGDPACNATP
jgi:probable HAF family extracellular repeat protein